MPDDLDDDATGTGDTDTSGGDGQAGDDTGAGTGGTGTGEAAKPTAPKVPNQAKPPKIEGDFDADRAARLIERLRNESKAEKEARAAAEDKQAAFLKAIAKAAGLAEEDKPDPEALTRQLEDARGAEKQRRTENMVLRLAPALGADPDVLLDSTSFLNALSGLDPEDRDGVQDVISDFQKKSTRYNLPTAKADDGEPKTTEPKKPAGRSGADLNGSASKPRQWTQAELDAASKAGRNRDIVDAQEKGLLDDILGV